MATGTVPKSVKATLYIDGKPAESSLKNVEQVSRSLSKELKSLEIGTDAWNRKMKEVQANKKYLQDIQNEIKGVGGAFGWLKTEVGKFGALAAGYLGLQFITSQFTNIIMSNAKLSDSLADLRRVAGLTEQEVMKLNKSFKTIDTRTSLSGLRDIAIVAGKLGVAKNEILGFTQATDKLVVSLGDELGNADQITTQLGKILNVFDGEVNGENISKLGNAFIKLANDGVATGAFMADFTQRVSSLTKTAGFSLGAVVGLGAGLEELGQRSESSSTAIQKVLSDIAVNLPAAAKVAGMGFKEFKQIFDNSPDEALIRYSQGLVANKNAFSEVAKAFKDAGEEGQRVITTIATIGTNADFMRGKIEAGKDAIQETAEINAAFALKNETLGGTLDRLSKAFNRLTTNVTLVNLFTSLVKGSLSFIEGVEKSMAAIKSIAKVLVIAVIAWGAYNLATFLATTQKKAWISSLISAAVLENLQIARTTAMGLITAVFTGNLSKARQELKLLMVLMNANPWGIALAAITALAAAFYLYGSSVTDAQRQLKDLEAIEAEALKNTVEQKDRIKAITDALANQNLETAEKKKLLEQLRELTGDYLKGLSDEEILTNKGSAAIAAYIKNLDAKLMAEAAYNLKKKLLQENIDLQNGGDVEVGYGEIIGGYLSGGSYNTIKGEKRKELVDQNNARLKSITATQGNGINKFLTGGFDVPNTNPELLGGGGSSGSSASKKEIDEAKKKRDKIKADQEKLKDELLKINQDIAKDQLEGFDKEVYEAGVKYQKLAELAHGNKELISQLYKKEFDEIEAIGLKFQKQAADKTKKEYEEKLKEFVKFKNELQNEIDVTDFRKDFTPEQIEVANEGDKYESAWKQLYAFHEAKVITDAQFAEIEIQLQENLQSRIAAVKKKWNDKTEKEKKDTIIQYAELVSDTVFSIIRNGQQAQSQETLNNIEQQRNAELSNKRLTEAQKQTINEKYEAQARAERLRAWKAEKAAAIGQAIINGALAVVKALPNIPLAVFAGAAALAQTAVIVAQKAPKFAGGGMTNKDPAGYVSSSTMFNNSASGRPFIAGEAGKEWIAPNWMLTDPRFSGIINNLEMARLDKRSFALGGFNSEQTSKTETPKFSQSNKSDKLDRLEMMMENLMKVQQAEMEKPIVFSQRVFEDESSKRIQVKNDASG